MLYPIYNAALALALPAARSWLKRSSKHAALRNRLAPAVPELPAPPIWVHACSVGEVNTAVPLLECLRRALPAAPVVLTTATATGQAHALERCAGLAAVTWCPVDTKGAVRRFLDAARPRALLLVETEVWPNLVRESRRRGVPVVIVNGRLSDRHYPGYARFRWLWRCVFSQLTAVSAQTEGYAERFRQLGARSDAITVTGSMKFDGVTTAVDARQRTRLRAACGIPSAAPVLLFGSTHPGEEELAVACWEVLREAIPDLRLVVAPRKVGRASEVRSLFCEPVRLRSEPGAEATGARVVVLDTLGELASLYAIASVAVVGGSFTGGVGGHNPLEPAALGVATVFGPDMSNFPEPASALLAAEGAIQVSCDKDLAPVLARLLKAPDERRQLGTRGRRAVLDHQGATARNAAIIQSLL